MKNLYEFGEMYHDYKIFGVINKQKGGIFPKNQKSKSPIISAYIQLAIAKSTEQEGDKVSFIELFCADAYYALVASHFGAYLAAGTDNNKVNHSNNTEKVAKKLGITNYKFILEEADNIHKLGNFDIVANIGGLYHVSNPKEILIKSYDMANKYLIVQTVVSMNNDSLDYFETPAPGWKWGSRYNRYSFDKVIKDLGWQVEDQYFNELWGNNDINSRGSVYYLIKKQ